MQKQVSAESTALRVEASPDLAGLDLAEVLRRAWLALKRNYWLLILTWLAFAALAALFAEHQDRFYRARASLMIDPRVNESMDASQAPTILLADALVVDTEVLVLQSERVLTRVVDRLDLVTKARAAYTAEGMPVPDDATLRTSLIASIASLLDIERDAPTYVVRITAQAGNPAAAANLANAVVDEYVAMQTLNQIEETDEVSAWLQQQTDRMSSQVVEAETKVQQYLFKNDIPDEDVVSATQHELDSATQALIDARNEASTAQSEIEIIDRTLNEAESGTGEDSPVILQTQLIEALGGDPKVRASKVPGVLKQMRETREAQILIARSQIAALEQREAQLKSDVAAINKKQVELRKIRREADAVQTQYEALLARLEKTRGEDRFFRSNARVIERAAAPTDPANPNLGLLVAAASVGGIIVGLGLVFLREQLDDTFRKSDDILEQLGIPYFGPLPLLDRASLIQILPHMPPNLDPKVRNEVAKLSYAAYAPFSLLSDTLQRTVIALQERRPSGRISVATVSAMSGEGKSLFASNLAFYVARQGGKVLLVDGDVRNPHLSRGLAPLFDRALAQVELPTSDTMVLTELTENLRVLHRRDTKELPDAERQRIELPALIQSAGAGSDFVVLDTAPLAFVSDDVSNLVDSAVLVIDWGRISAAALRRVLRLSPALAEKLAGACLSKTRVARMQKYEHIPVSNAYYNSGVVVAKPVGRG